MANKVFLVHGYSVTNTETYQSLHRKLAQYGYQLHEVFLGRYVSLDDEVTVPDLARAMHNELRRHLGKGAWAGQRFHIITHSTGALVARHWIADHYEGKYAKGRPLRNLVMLAGPQFGSRLAHQGKSMLARIKFWGDTGKRVLTELELGSAGLWRLNEQWCDTSIWKGKGIRPFCLVGASAHPGFLTRTLVSATNEKGSDGVVRAAAANLNHRRYEVDLVANSARRAGEITGVPFGVLAPYEHSGEKNGIMNSITSVVTRQNHQALDLILKCLAVSNDQQYSQVRTALHNVSATTAKEKGSFAQLDFRIRDANDRPVEDYSILIGHPQAGVDELRPAKIVTHTHRNRVTENHFTVFLDMKRVDPAKVYALKITAESHTPLVSYDHAWYPTYKAGKIHELLIDSQTTLVDVKLSRDPQPGLFVFHAGDSGDPAGQNPGEDPLHIKWDRSGKVTGKGIPWT